MKILYGVQGTGNGHITRARMMAEAFKKYSVTVDFIFSGKDDAYFNMEPFGYYKTFPGLSFVAQQGKVKYFKTLRRNNLLRFIRDIKNLNVKDYDLVISDFEPISAWAARLRDIPSIGISHQNAFRHKIPLRGENLLANTIIKYFAPTDQSLGLHWHHFDQAILPPMIKTDLTTTTQDKKKVLVYLPFMEQKKYQNLFIGFPDYRFVQYHPIAASSTRGNVTYKPLSRKNFLEDFKDCSGVICSAGFGACSEAIHYGKKLFAIPLQGQMEQLSNAAALEQLGYGTVREKLKRKPLEKWLHQASPRPVNFPDVAEELVQWILDGRKQRVIKFSKKLWAKVPEPNQLTPTEAPKNADLVELLS